MTLLHATRDRQVGCSRLPFHEAIAVAPVAAALVNVALLQRWDDAACLDVIVIGTGPAGATSVASAELDVAEVQRDRDVVHGSTSCASTPGQVKMYGSTKQYQGGVAAPLTPNLRKRNTPRAAATV